MNTPLKDPQLDVWNHSKAKGTDLVILLAIAKYADEGGYAFPGPKRLGEMARVGPQSVKAAVGRLEAAGELAVFRGQGRGNKSLYRILLGQPEDAADLKVMLAWLKGRTEPFLQALSKRYKRLDLSGIEKGYPAIPLPAWEKGPSATPIEPEKGYPATEEKGSSAISSSGAYRNELPVTEQKSPPPPSSAAEPGTEKPTTAQTLLDEHIKALGVDRLFAVKRLGAVLKGYLSEGVDPDELRRGLAYMRERNLTQPSALPGVLDQLNGKPASGNGYRNGQPERRGPTIPEADLSQLPPTDPDKLAAWYDRQLEGIPT